MADSAEADKTANWLKSFYTESSELNPSNLNTALRKCLRMFAASQRHKFAQDQVGNIYITRAGRDPELSSIALTFPLDSSTSPEALDGAIRTFLAVHSRSTTCDLTLLGWSSPGGSLIGRDVWEGTLSAVDGHVKAPELKQFSSMEDVAKFPLSAVLELVQTDGSSTILGGSPVLTQKAKTVAGGSVRIESENRIAKRAPELTISSKDAVAVGAATVELYSKYVAALFDNFD